MTVPPGVQTQAFTVELWIVNHVNRPVGVTVSRHAKAGSAQPAWKLIYHADKLGFFLGSKGIDEAAVAERWKGRWVHITGTFDGTTMRLYVNGQIASKVSVESKTIGDFGQHLEIVGDLANEPFMQVGDLVKNVRLLDYAANATEIAKRYGQLQDMVNQGALMPDRFHFTAGPYLNDLATDGVRLVWETDRAAASMIRYGTTLPLSDSLALGFAVPELHDQGVTSNIRKASVSGLQPGTPYFYEIEAMDSAGDTIRSGICTFATAAENPGAFCFSVLGDTEARPHINNRIAKLIWAERPDFGLHLGDITDGGDRENKYEWNYEYFTGMGQLLERMVLFPVPGNGEDDLYWYNRYHALPQNDGYYRFTHGDAEFFMLDSNKPEELRPGGVQHDWLEQALRTSSARWKFVAHHHAPYSADDDDYGDSWRGQSTLGDKRFEHVIRLYERHGVDMVFYGHLHTYQRTHPIRENRVHQQGVTYVQAGGAGGNLEDFTPTRAWYSARTYRGHHYCTVTVVGDKMSLKTYDADGHLIDYLDSTKQHQE